MAQERDELVPDPQVPGEFGRTLMTLWRWTKNGRLGFPQVIKINGRNYRLRSELESFKERILKGDVL